MLNTLALTAGFAATAFGAFCDGPYFSFYSRPGPAMSFQRLDPALFPGQQSPHLHSFDGGNGLAADMTFANTQESTCSTVRIKTDKSLYWRPTLFWNGNNTGYYKVPERFTKIYYKFGNNDASKSEVSEFPEDFSMMVGDPFRRSDDGNNPGSVKWACLGGNSRIDSMGFPKGFTSCKEGLTSEVTFPACWNGKKLDPANPSAHMAWPTGNGKGIDQCPEGFKEARFPTIFIEFWYDVSSFDNQYTADEVPWALANGDPTGFGFHADFRNGWEKDVLAKATAMEGYCSCGCGCDDDKLKTCFGAENVNNDNDDAFKTCSAKTAFTADDTMAIDKLPGCNPMQPGPEEATVVTGPGCTASAAAPSSGSNNSSAVEPSATKASTAQAVAASGTTEAAAPSKVEVADASDFPTLSIPLHNKGETHVANAGNGDVAGNAQESNGYPTAKASLSPVSSAASPAETAGDGNTACEGTVRTATVTDTATVTVTVGSYMARHKRHGNLHHYS